MIGPSWFLLLVRIFKNRYFNWNYPIPQFWKTFEKAQKEQLTGAEIQSSICRVWGSGSEWRFSVRSLKKLLRITPAAPRDFRPSSLPLWPQFPVTELKTTATVQGSCGISSIMHAVVGIPQFLIHECLGQASLRLVDFISFTFGGINLVGL